MSSWKKVANVFTNRKMFVIFLLGISSGLPYLMTASTLGFWLSEADISLKDIGAMALVGIFYNLKFLWAPFIDIIKIPILTEKLGRRRAWLLVTQILLAASLIGMATTNPSQSLLPMVIFSLAVAFFSATQDIVVDAFRIDSFETEEQAAGAVSSVYGYRIGLYVAGAIGLKLSDYISWNEVYLFFAATISIGVIATLIATEPNFKAKEKFKNFFEIFKYAALNPFVDFMKRKYWLVLLIFIVAYKFPGAFLGGGLMSAFYLDMGFSKDEIFVAVKTFGFAAGILGLFVGGLLATKVGLLKALIIDIILQAVTNLLFIPLVYATGNTVLLTIAVCADSMAASMGTVVLVAFISALCNKQYSATQYALLSSLAALGRTLLAANSGWIVEDIGWVNFYVLTFASALPALLLIPYVAKYLDEKNSKASSQKEADENFIDEKTH